MAFYQLEPWGCPVEDDRVRTMTHILLAPDMRSGTAFPTMFDRDPAPIVETDDDEGIMAFFGARVVEVEPDEEMLHPVIEPTMTPEDIARHYGLCPIEEARLPHK